MNQKSSDPFREQRINAFEANPIAYGRIPMRRAAQQLLSQSYAILDSGVAWRWTT
jgi:hypothetical protein